MCRRRRHCLSRQRLTGPCGPKMRLCGEENEPPGNRVTRLESAAKANSQANGGQACNAVQRTW